ncbi:hypothetical protein ABD87_14660 [Lysinibacillus sphaericus]|uniref:hypothetical protein n=1 Tax=Lysinibacillus sphaericus TaxID=1421 RepID=UPI0018CD8F3F|nr:hypothetical protein [Lysinibacillus sphaericus]MBG9730742.1 hypothetical protein [Lysinibacillus sphaericus]
MESTRVQELREEYGIKDSRNIYTEEQIIKISQQKLYYICPKKDDLENILIEYKQILGYVSEDESACIFIKDSEITGYKTYVAMKGIGMCAKIKEGIYHDVLNDVIYCTTEDLQFSLDYAKEIAKREIQEQIKELEQEILRLRNSSIIFSDLMAQNE